MTGELRAAREGFARWPFAFLLGFLFVSSLLACSGSSSSQSPAQTTYRMSGTITGAAASGVTVTVSGAASATTTSDASGAWSVATLANGSYVVTPSRTGFTFVPASATVTIDGGDVTVPAFAATAVPPANTYRLSGTVTGAVLAGVTVTVTGPPNATAATSQSGSWSVTGLANGSYVVTPTLAGYTFTPASATATINGADATVPAFSASAVPSGGSHALSGSVQGAVLEGVTVQVSGPASGSATTDASGRWSVAGLPNGTYVVVMFLAQYSFTPASATVMVNGADAVVPPFTNVSSSVPPNAERHLVRGRIPNMMQGLSVDVLLTGALSVQGSINDSGAFIFTGLPNGTYGVTPAFYGYVFTPPSAAVTLNGADVTLPDFIAAPGPFRVDSVEPTEAHVGERVDIYGGPFGTITSTPLQVTLNGVAMPITYVDDGNVRLTVPAGAGSGPLQVHRGSEVFPAGSFLVTATVSGRVVDGAPNAQRMLGMIGGWLQGRSGPAKVIVSASGSTRSAVAEGIPGTTVNFGPPLAYTLELPLGRYDLSVKAYDNPGFPELDVFQGSTVPVPITVGEAGLTVDLPVRWHWEMVELDPGFNVCEAERQIHFYDALNGYVVLGVGNMGGVAVAMRTQDGGKTWSLVSRDASLAYGNDFRPYTGQWFDSGYLLSYSDGTVLSTGIAAPPGYNRGPYGVLSRDSAASWSAAYYDWRWVGPGNGEGSRFAPAGPNRIYASFYSGGVQGSAATWTLSVSTDRGANWSALYLASDGNSAPPYPLGFGGLDVACSDVDPTRCITMGGYAIFTTKDAFATYANVTPPCPISYGQVVWRKGTLEVWLVAATNCGTTKWLRSTDGGETWGAWQEWPQPSYLVTFADTNTLFQWWDGWVWVSRDAGGTWKETGRPSNFSFAQRTFWALDADHAWTLGNPDCRQFQTALVGRWVK